VAGDSGGGVGYSAQAGTELGVTGDCVTWGLLLEGQCLSMQASVVVGLLKRVSSLGPSCFWRSQTESWSRAARTSS